MARNNSVPAATAETADADGTGQISGEQPDHEQRPQRDPYVRDRKIDHGKEPQLGKVIGYFARRPGVASLARSQDVHQYRNGHAGQNDDENGADVQIGRGALVTVSIADTEQRGRDPDRQPDAD